MTKRIHSCFLAIMLLALLCTSCDRAEQLPDAYVDGSDYQYMNFGSNTFYPDVSKGNKGYYTFFEGYVYFLDEDTDTLLPLCNKVDCLHDKETDPGKYSYCNACFLSPMGYMLSELGLAYCNGYLYCVSAGGPTIGPALYRLSEDGATKELLYQWKDHTTLHSWMIHRDILYYVEYTYAVKDEGESVSVEEQYSLNSLPLAKSIRQPRRLYTPDENWEVYTIQDLMAYGNYGYFSIHAIERTEDEITDDNYLDYTILKTYICNLSDGQIYELENPEMSKGGHISKVTFWQGRIIFDVYDTTRDNMKPNNCYIADLNGSNMEVFMDDIPQAYVLISDGMYLYITDYFCSEQPEKIYQVYNEKLELIDTFITPFVNPYGYMVIGEPEQAYFRYYSQSDPDDESTATWGMARWDKSGIGTYNGKVFEVTKIPR